MLEFNSVNNDCVCTPENLQQFSDPSCSNPSVITWESLQGKPSCFTPCAHTHVPGDIIGLSNYIQNTIFANSIVNTNSIELTAPSGVLNANLKISANAGTGYKVPLSILSDGLIGQIPYANSTTSGILNVTDWIVFNNKFNTPTGTTNQYVRGDGSLATFPSIITTTRQINTASPLTGGGDLSSDRTLSIPAATTSVNGYLTSTDWNTFNNKLSNSLVDGLIWIGNSSNIATPKTLTLNSTPGLFALSNTGELTFPNASTTERGLLTSTDWNIFNGKWTKPSFTTGSVLFWDGSDVGQNNSNFFWDNAFKTLILGSNSIIPTDEQLIIYNSTSAKALLSGVLGATLVLKSTTATDRSVTLRSGTLGSQLFSSSNVPLSLFINGRSDGIELDTEGRTNLTGGISTNVRYVNVDSLTVNIAKNENFVLINAGAITGITGSTPLTIILPETPVNGQEVSIGVCNGTSGITLGTAEILIQGFGGTSIVINHLPELNGGLNNGISGCTYKYSSSILRWFRVN